MYTVRPRSLVHSHRATCVVKMDKSFRTYSTMLKMCRILAILKVGYAAYSQKLFFNPDLCQLQNSDPNRNVDAIWMDQYCESDPYK